MNKVYAICGLLAFFGMMGSCSYVVHNDNATMLRMVENGVSVLEARCAVKESGTQMCAIVAAKND